MIKAHRVVNSRLPLLLSRLFSKQVFILPDLGEKIKEGEIKKLHVKEGSVVKEYDLIAEVATDKATAEITSPFDGKIVKLFHKENEMCNVGDPFFEIDTDATETAGPGKHNEAIADSDAPALKTAKALEEKPGRDDKKGIDDDEESEGRLKAQPDSKDDSDLRPAQNLESSIRTTLTSPQVLSTPAVRAFAKLNNVDITRIKPSGRNGRVLKEDIIDYLERVEKRGLKAPTTASHVVAEKPKENAPVVVPCEAKTVKMNSFERGMVKSMTYAASVPHFNLSEEFDIHDLSDMREKLKKRGFNVSLFALIAKAFSLALHDHPKMNSTYNPEKDQFSYILNDMHNISIAIDSQIGLVAPNIKNAQNLSALEIDMEVKHLRDLANQQKLSSEHLTGGTIALSNIGTIAGHYASPLNLPGQTCIVALGKVLYKPVYDEASGTFTPKRVLPVSFGCDHRVLDGASVAKFALHWKNYIENPYLILAKLK